MAFEWDWSARADDLGVAVFAHRAAARGHAITLTARGYRGPQALADKAARVGLSGKIVDASGERSETIRLPRIVLYAGASIGYPYYAYYAHSLWSLGLEFRLASANDIADGLLDHADLFVIPGGFATWGLDRIEEIAGIDAAVSNFIARGGACIGSCGGAFYLSEGRPGWQRAIDAKPRFTHEYLLTGTCLLNLQLTDARLRRDLPESLEVPYYHGPVYDATPRGSQTLATFGEHVLANRLFIDNPIDAERYDAVMRGRVAVLSGRTPQHRVVGFSAHPEMGEFLRKGMTLDRYVRHYLPIRGPKTMDETMRFYAREDCIAFRLILNAAIMLGVFDGASGVSQSSAGDTSTSARAGIETISHQWKGAATRLHARVATTEEDAGLAALVEKDLRRIESEWQRLSEDPHVQRGLQIHRELSHVLTDALKPLAAERAGSVPETLVLLELPVRLASAWTRMAHCEATIGEES